MLCEKCKKEMCHFIEGSTQGWRCPLCGWDIVTTYIADIYTDLTEYSLYVNREPDINTDKIRRVAGLLSVHCGKLSNYFVQRMCGMGLTDNTPGDNISKKSNEEN